jgi:hypothetical protein
LNLKNEKSLDADELHMGTDWSWYEGITIKGWPEWTILRGKVIVEHEKYVGKPGDGNELYREIKREYLEIAVSILAEIIKEKRKGASLL